ncbi:MAG TPA: Sir2 family NAD-dependent protein deacetylase, partial [Bacteroidia bacterium]|nr:Sir2 family NAD-dependent protein deacetylase [Bacteroidia bacterium]
MKKVVVFTGSGIIADSGIRTFRDHDGLWDNYKIEEVAT